MLKGVCKCYSSSQVLAVFASLVSCNFSSCPVSIPSISRNANPVALSPFSLVSRLPIKKLLVCARLSPRQFGNLYSHLLRLLITHLPHLCLAQDWLAEESELSASFANASSLASSAAVGQSGSDSPSTVKRKRKASRNFRGWIEPLERRIRIPSAEELSLGTGAFISCMNQDIIFGTSYAELY